MHEPIKNIPLPSAVASRRGKGRPRKYPFETMEVGDMFFVPNRTKNNMTTHASAVGSKLGKKFATRRIYMTKEDGQWRSCESHEEGAIMGIGVWREK